MYCWPSMPAIFLDCHVQFPELAGVLLAEYDGEAGQAPHKLLLVLTETFLLLPPSPLENTSVPETASTGRREPHFSYRYPYSSFFGAKYFTMVRQLQVCMLKGQEIPTGTGKRGDKIPCVWRE